MGMELRVGIDRIRAGVDRGPRSRSRKQWATEMEALDLQLGDTALTSRVAWSTSLTLCEPQLSH